METDWSLLENVKKEYDRRGVIFFYHNSIFYYKNKPCERVKEIPAGGKIIDEIFDYPAGCYKVTDTGYIFGNTICGYLQLKILE